MITFKLSHVIKKNTSSKHVKSKRTQTLKIKHPYFITETKYSNFEFTAQISKPKNPPLKLKLNKQRSPVQY